MKIISKFYNRESAAIYVCKLLLDEGANLNIVDPKVDEEQIYLELSNSQFNLPIEKLKNQIKIFSDDALEACKQSHAIVVCTEWDVFKVSLK